MIITLIGSRNTPKDVLSFMEKFVEDLNPYDVLFRSGGADGADSVVTNKAINREIYIPWEGFNNAPEGIIPFYTERNGYRMPDYHRLDLGLTWYMKEREKFEHNMNFSIYNAYNRENAYAINFKVNPDNPDQTQAVQTTLFKIIPF